LVSILLITLILAPITLSATKPDWVSVGKYAEYELILEGSDGTRETGYVRIEIKEVYNDHAVLKVSINIPGSGSEDREDTWYYDKSYHGIILNPAGLRAKNYPIEDKSVPAGTFKCYKVERVSGTAWYEVSTGLLVYGEVAVLGARGIVQLKSTNIIGGFPWLLIIAVIVIVVVVAVVLVVVSKIRKVATTAPPPTQPPTPEAPTVQPPPTST